MTWNAPASQRRSRLKWMTVMLCAFAVLGASLGALLDQFIHTGRFTSMLRNSDEVIDMTAGFHAGDVLLPQALAYIGVFLCSLFVLFLCWVWHEPTPLEESARQGGKTPLFPMSLIALTAVASGVASGFIGNRWLTGVRFEHRGVTTAVSHWSVFEPWHEMAEVYPPLLASIGAATLACWVLWFAGRQVWSRLDQRSLS